MELTPNELAMPFIYLMIILFVLNAVVAIVLKLMPISQGFEKYIYGLINVIGLVYWFQYTFL